MSDLLAIIGPVDGDGQLLDEIARRRPHRVTVLVDQAGPDWGSDESTLGHARRDRLAGLLAAIERRTGAVVVGLAGSREQLRGWRFDRVVGAPEGCPASEPADPRPFGVAAIRTQFA
jgi:hypothetical protein